MGKNKSKSRTEDVNKIRNCKQNLEADAREPRQRYVNRKTLFTRVIVSNLVVIVGNINEGGIAILAYESQGFV